MAMTEPDQYLLETVIPKWEEELDGWIAERKSLDARIEARTRSLEAVKRDLKIRAPRLFEAPAQGQSNGVVLYDESHKLNTGEALELLLAIAHEPLTRGQLYSLLEEHGWAPDGKNPKAAVGSALWYLANKKKTAEKTIDGWQLIADLREAVLDEIRRRDESLLESLEPPEGGSKTEENPLPRGGDFP
jgi:hypothetical protein